jgi:hypothetical protein
MSWQIIISFAKVQNNADITKRFWRINAVRSVIIEISWEIGADENFRGNLRHA